MIIAFISGHLDLTEDEFNAHYVSLIDAHAKSGGTFVVGDARGADHLAQQYLQKINVSCTVYHMLDKPRNNVGFPTRGGFGCDTGRDKALTAASALDIAWVRPGREQSGTARNLERRHKIQSNR